MIDLRVVRVDRAVISIEAYDDEIFVGRLRTVAVEGGRPAYRVSYTDVEPSHRRCGIARLMLARAARLAFERESADLVVRDGDLTDDGRALWIALERAGLARRTGTGFTFARPPF